MSVNKGETISFKIKSATSNYHIDILRLGYYGGDGARHDRRRTSRRPGRPRSRPARRSPASGLIDCGNWSVSRSWTVPEHRRVRRLHRAPDAQRHGRRQPASSSSSATTRRTPTWWCRPPTRRGRRTTTTAATASTSARSPARRASPSAYKAAYKVSYNRPLDTTEGPSALFTGAEYPMIRFLEANGYDATLHQRRRRAPPARAAAQPQAVHLERPRRVLVRDAAHGDGERASGAGVNLAFFSGNEGFWKTRWEPSAAGTTTADRTLVSYKDTHFTERQDPVEWTGTWRDPRFTTAAENVTPGERADRPVVRGQLGHDPDHGALRLPPAAHVAQHRGHVARSQPVARSSRPTRSATSGTRIPTTASARRARSGSPRRRSATSRRSRTTGAPRVPTAPRRTT